MRTGRLILLGSLALIAAVAIVFGAPLTTPDLRTQSDEITSLKSRQTTAESGLVTETSRAQVAEGSLSTRIVTETNRAQAAEALLATIASLVIETNRAQVAEATKLAFTGSTIPTSTNGFTVANSVWNSNSMIMVWNP